MNAAAKLSHRPPLGEVHNWTPMEPGVDTQTGRWFLHHSLTREVVAGHEMLLMRAVYLGNSKAEGSYTLSMKDFGRYRPLDSDHAHATMKAAYAILNNKAQARKFRNPQLYNKFAREAEAHATQGSPKDIAQSMEELAATIAQVTKDNKNGFPVAYYSAFDKLAYTFAHLVEAVYGTPAAETYTGLVKALLPEGGSDRLPVPFTHARADVIIGRKAPPAGAPQPEPQAALTSLDAVAAAITDPDDLQRLWRAREVLDPRTLIIYGNFLVPPAQRASAIAIADSLDMEIEEVRRIHAVAAATMDALIPRPKPMRPVPAAPAKQEDGEDAKTDRKQPAPPTARSIKARTARLARPGFQPRNFGHITVLENRELVESGGYAARMLDGSGTGIAPQCFSILEYLHARAGRFVPRAEMIAALFGTTNKSEGQFNSALVQLRRALEEHFTIIDPAAAPPAIIVTVRSEGIRLLQPGETWAPPQKAETAPLPVRRPAAPKAAHTSDTVLESHDYGTFLLEKHDGWLPWHLVHKGRTLKLSDIAGRVLRHAADPERRGTWITRKALAEALAPGDDNMSGNLRTTLATLMQNLSATYGAEAVPALAGFDSVHGFCVPRAGEPLPAVPQPAPYVPPPPEIRDYGRFSVTIKKERTKDVAHLTGTSTVVPPAMVRFLDLLKANTGAWTTRHDIGAALFSGQPASNYVLAKRLIDHTRTLLSQSLDAAASGALCIQHGAGVTLLPPGVDTPPPVPATTRARATRSEKPARGSAERPVVATHSFGWFSVIQHAALRRAYRFAGTDTYLSSNAFRILQFLASTENAGKKIHKSAFHKFFDVPHADSIASGACTELVRAITAVLGAQKAGDVLETGYGVIAFKPMPAPEPLPGPEPVQTPDAVNYVLRESAQVSDLAGLRHVFALAAQNLDPTTFRVVSALYLRRVPNRVRDPEILANDIGISVPEVFSRAADGKRRMLEICGDSNHVLISTWKAPTRKPEQP